MLTKKAWFPKLGQLVGDNLDKMAKTFMKVTKLAFLGQNSGGGGHITFYGNGGDPPSPPTRGNPEKC